ncbi:hypothetical protein [Allosphingosinicella sp.]|uniref:hypothetical protein n=1 Tax=Allosphingosinicella sp. TaxID=2823234 RepID=UPI003D7377B3
MTATGGKLWRLKYRAHGSERKLSLGKYRLSHSGLPARLARKRRRGSTLRLKRGAIELLRSWRRGRHSVRSRSNTSARRNARAARPQQCLS